MQGNGSEWDDDGSIQTFSGKRFYPLNPNPDDICIEDITHALAHQCRFAGHIEKFYSIAQHSVIVSEQTEGSAMDKLCGLLHDATEAYLCDVPRPLKHSEHFKFYRQAELNLAVSIWERFGLPWHQPEGFPPAVKVADTRALQTEANALLVGGPQWTYAEPYSITIVPWGPIKAEFMFRNRFIELTGEVLREKDQAVQNY